MESDPSPGYGYQAPAPAYHAPAPVYQAPAPAYQAPAFPSYDFGGLDLDFDFDHLFGGHGHGHGGHGHAHAQVESGYYTSDSSDDYHQYPVTTYVTEEYKVPKKIPVNVTTEVPYQVATTVYE